MKRVISFLIVAAICIASFLFLGVGAAMAQSPPGDVVQPVEQVVSLDMTTLFSYISGLAAGVLFFTSMIKKTLGSNGAVTIIISLVVSFALSAIGWLLQLGIFGGVLWYYIFIYGVIATLLANGLASWPVIQQILVLFKLKLPSN